MADTEMMRSDKESIELSVNTKGQYTWVIKLKSELVGEEILTRLSDLDSKLKLKYPHVEVGKSA